MGATKTDDELTELLTMLYTMQEDVGAKPKSSDQDKKNRAANIAITSMGKTKKAQQKGSRFIDLKSSIVDRLKTIHETLQDIKARESSGFGGDNPKEIIKAQTEVREQIRQATDEWKEMDQLYKNEARKKRSKFSQEELELQATLVIRLRQEIDRVKEAQLKSYQRGGGPPGPDAGLAASLPATFGAPASSNARPGGTSWAGGGGGGGGGAALTSDQRTQIQLLEDRDAEFDQELDDIAEGIADLTEIAKLQGEEVARQNVMLDSLENKLDNVQEHVSTVNARMKETLDEVGRSGDKLCVDIMCIVLAVGFAAVFYNMSKGGF